MRIGHAICLFLLLSGISPQASADEFDDEFCFSMTHVAAEENSKSPFWTDAYTRQDWMTVDCDVKLVNWKKYVKRTSDPFELAEQRKKVSDYFCTQNRSFAEALAKGWTVSFSVKFSDQTETYISAKCGKSSTDP
jgi:hypothetical protein